MTTDCTGQRIDNYQLLQRLEAEALARSTFTQTILAANHPPSSLMNNYNPDRSEPVILSAAKNLCVASEILRCAQNDIPEFDR